MNPDFRYARRKLFSLLLVTACVALPPGLPADDLPATPAYPVVRKYHHGAQVTDPYQWLEEVDASAVRQWVEAQNRYAEDFLEQLPNLEEIGKRVDALVQHAPPFFEEVQCRNGVICAIQDGALVVLKSLQRPIPKRRIVDPEKAIPGADCEIDFYALSPNGRYVAVCLSRDGLEDGTGYVYETDTGLRRDDVIPQLSGPPGGDLVWNRDSSAVYYTRYPFASLHGVSDHHRYSCIEIWMHALGSDAADDVSVCGHEFHRFSQCVLQASPYSDDVLIQVSYGSGGSGQSLFLIHDGQVRQIARPEDEIAGAAFVSPEALLVESCQSAPYGKLLAWRWDATPLSDARVLVPERDSILYDWDVGDRTIFVTEFKGGQERLRLLDKDSGEALGACELPPFCAVTDACYVSNDQLLYRVESYRESPAWYVLDPMKPAPEPVALSKKCPINFEDVEVVQECAPTRDGTQVPLTILRPAGTPLDGERPVLLTGYGGSKFRETPWFDVQRRIWFDHGGVIVVAHPRGDGELGEDWFRPTLRGNKQLTRDDFIACAEHLIAREYTNPARLAIQGGSHGGLLVGMALSSRPELFAAAIADCGDLCVLQSGLSPFGLHLVCEYGSVDHAAEFERMRSFSPYERVTPGREYPAIWIRTGSHDRRVMPWNSWKMAARLQASGSKKPVLLSTAIDEGHNFDTDMAEELAFLFAQLNVTFRTVGTD